MSESDEIPEDILNVANQLAYAWAMPDEEAHYGCRDDIARAILAERERAANTITASVVLSALERSDAGSPSNDFELIDGWYDMRKLAEILAAAIRRPTGDTR